MASDPTRNVPPPATSLDKRHIRVLLLEGVHASAEDALRRADYTAITSIPQALPEADLIEALRGVHMLGIRSRTQITARVIESADKLMVVGCFCIGTNQVDAEAALAAGVPVFNAPYSNTRSVAELVIAEAILLLRGVPQKNALMHRGIWRKSAANAFEIRGKTLGIVGYGNIGSQVSVMAESLGMQVRFHDVTSKLSRGSVVDLDALAAALDKGHLLGAAINVFPSEPRNNYETFVSPLQNGFRDGDNTVTNVLLTPHVGGSTVEAQENIGTEVADKLITYSDNGSTIASVNFPQAALPSHPGAHRLLHIHKNVPGVMSDINQVFSEENINISGQYLQTNADVGYVVIDVDAKCSRVALARLRSVPGTIRTRVLF